MKRISKALLSILLFGIFSSRGSAEPIAKIPLQGTLYNVDMDAVSPSSRILLRLFPLKQRYENGNAGPCPNARWEPKGPAFRLVTDSTGGFAVRVPAGQYFAVVTSESFGLVSACLTVAGLEDVGVKACGAISQGDGRPLQSMIVRYSRKLRFFHGDILMSHPCAPVNLTACESLRHAYPLLLDARQIQLQYDGKPLRNAQVKVGRPSKLERDLFSLQADARGTLDAGLLYSAVGGIASRLVLTIPVADGAARIVVDVAPEPAANKQTFALFRRRKCGWDAEVTP